MLEKISKILYVFLISLFLLAIFIYFTKGTIFLDTKIFYIIFLLLLPFLDFFIESIKKSFTFGNLSMSYGDNFIKYIGLLIVGTIFYIYGVETRNIGVMLFFLFSLLFKIDSRISFIGALFLLIITPIYLVIGNKDAADSSSIFAYYMLIIGVILEIVNHFHQNKEIPDDTSNNSSDNSSVFDEIVESLGTYINSLKNRITEVKKNILEEIGEGQIGSKEKSEQSIKIKDLKKTEPAAFIINSKQNFYIKLIKYFVSKAKENIYSITLFLFSINIVLILLILGYSFIESISFYTFISLFISYFVSKIMGVKYSISILQNHNTEKGLDKKNLSKDITIEDIILNTENLSKDEIENISKTRNYNNPRNIDKRNNFFINKAIIFSSFGLLSCYLLMEYFRVNENGITIYIGTFLLFFVTYYIAFSDWSSQLLRNNDQILGKHISNFSIKNFIKRHIYLLLNLILVFTILTVLGFQTGIFADWYKSYKEKVGYENWTLTPDAILKNQTAEKMRIGETLRPKIDIMSNEAQVQERITENDTGKINLITDDDSQLQGNTSETSPIKNQKISVKEYHTFTQTLNLGAKNDEVTKLEEIMIKLNYYDNEADNLFEQATKDALTNLLRTECNWPESTKGILGNQAMQCLYSLKIDADISGEN